MKLLTRVKALGGRVLGPGRYEPCAWGWGLHSRHEPCKAEAAYWLEDDWYCPTHAATIASLIVGPKTAK